MSTKQATPSRNPPVAAATAAGSATGRARSIGRGSASTGRGRTSASTSTGSASASSIGSGSATRRIYRWRRTAGLELARVNPVFLVDSSAQGLHPAVQALVVLEHPAALAPLDPGALGLAEVLDVQAGGHAGVLVGGLHAREADPEAVDDPLAAQVVQPAEREQAAVHAGQH